MAARPSKNSDRFRQRLPSVYASETFSGSRVFQASSAARTLVIASSRLKGGTGGRDVMAPLPASPAGASVGPPRVVERAAGGRARRDHHPGWSSLSRPPPRVVEPVETTALGVHSPGPVISTSSITRVGEERSVRRAGELLGDPPHHVADH